MDYKEVSLVSRGPLAVIKREVPTRFFGAIAEIRREELEMNAEHSYAPVYAECILLAWALGGIE